MLSDAKYRILKFLNNCRVLSMLSDVKTFAVTPKYDNYQLWIHGRQVGFVAESGKTPAYV